MTKRVTTVRLTGIERAALDVVATAKGISPEHLLQDLIRDAAISHITGKSIRQEAAVTVATEIVGNEEAG